MSRPSHQFVVPAYLDSPYLSRCVESVCTQTDKSKVIITTSTPSRYVEDVAKRYNVPVHVRDGDSSIHANWNYALSSATEDLVTFAHQDDVYYPGFSEQTRDLFAAAPDASLSFTDYEEIDSNGKRLPAGHMMGVKRALRYFAIGGTEIVRSRAHRRRLVMFGSVIPCPSVTLNRKLMPDFHFGGDYRINLDWDAWLRLHTLDNPFLRSGKILMGHRIHPEAITSKSKRDGQRAAEDLMMFRRMWPGPLASALAAVYRLSY